MLVLGIFEVAVMELEWEMGGKNNVSMLLFHKVDLLLEQQKKALGHSQKCIASLHGQMDIFNQIAC